MAESIVERKTGRPGWSPARGEAEEAPPFALAEALEVVEGEAPLLQEMAGVFLRLAPSLLEGIQEALQAGDTYQVAKNLRELGQRAASVGAMAFLEETCSLQEVLSKGEVSHLPTFLDNLGLLLEGYKEALAIVDWEDLGYGF